jgi:intracellular multiplication protein IcmE
MTDKQNKPKLANSKSRLLIAAGVGVLVIVIAIVVVIALRSGGPGTGASISALPDIQSVPGAGTPSDAYVGVQTKQNIKKTQHALHSGGSSVPTITRSSFIGDMSPFEMQHKDDNKNYRAPQCQIPAVGPAACTAEKLKLARQGGVGAAELRCRGCQCPALKLAGYTAGDMKQAGWDAKTLTDCGYSLKELAAAGYSAADLAAAGYSLADLKKAGFSAAQLKAAGFSAAQLKAAGFSAADLAAAGFSAKELKAAGFSAAELKKAGFSAADLKNAGFSAKDIKAAGYSAADMLAAGYSPSDLKKVGFSAAEIAKGEAVLAARGSNLKRCSVSELRKSRAAHMSAVSIKKLGCSAAAMRAAGYTAAELKAAGFSAKALRAAGFSASQLKAAGFSAKDLKAAGYSAAQLKGAGFSAKELKAAGFSAKDLKAAGFSASELKKSGFSAAALAKSGYSAAALKGAGFSPTDLKKAGFSAADLRAAGFTAGDLKKAGYSPEDLRDAGYTDGDLLRAGFKPKDLGFGDKSSQCSVALLTKARSMGVPASALRKKGCSAYALRQAGYTPADLKAAGFTAGELRDAGFSAAALKKAGFSAAELRAAGFSAKNLSKAGYSAAELHAAGFTAAELKKAGFSAAALRAAGYRAGEIAAATSGAMDSIGGSKDCTSSMLARAHELGVSGKSLLDQGCSAEALTKAGFSLPTVSETLSSASTMPSFAGGTQAQRLAYLQAKQQAQLAAQQQQQAILTEQQNMMGQAQTMLSTWGTPPPAGAPHEVPAPADTGAGMNAANAGGVMSAGTVKAGSVMFAILETGINSDEVSPILAKIVSGTLQGSKILGKFSRINDKLMITFNVINMPGYQSTTNITAVAIDAATARTAVSGLTNYHYWLRYGSLFASSFLSGVSQGLTSSSQTLKGGFLMPVLQQRSLSPTEEIMTGLGKAGEAYASVMGANFTVPPTVKIPSGAGIGVLFMSDFKIPVKGNGLMGAAMSGSNPLAAKAKVQKASAGAAATKAFVASTSTFGQAVANAAGTALTEK